MEGIEEANTFKGRPDSPSPQILNDLSPIMSKFRMLEAKVAVLEAAQSRLLQENVILEGRSSGVSQPIHSVQE